jgi:hypothetical protein
MQAIDREQDRTDGLFEGSTPALVSGNDAFQQDKFELFIVLRQKAFSGRSRKRRAMSLGSLAITDRARISLAFSRSSLTRISSRM